jgi:hypothetical protein
MSRLMFDYEGNRVPAGPNSVTRRARESFMDGVLPTWLEISEGTGISYPLGADGTVNGWLVDRGAYGATTTTTTNSRATMRTARRFSWHSFGAVFVTFRSFRLGADTNLRAEIAIMSDDGQYGIELRQTAAETTATMRTVNAGTVTTTVVPLLLRNAGNQTIGLGIYPRTNEWCVTSEDQILSHGTAPGWSWLAATPQMLRPRISVQTLTTVAKSFFIGDFEVTAECY